MDGLEKLLHAYGHIGVQGLQMSVDKVSATHETEKSIRYELVKDDTEHKLLFIGRKFFSQLETGRGPRKSSSYGGFDKSMEKYMEARGIGSDLNPKQRKQLARFLTLKINREGDQTFKQGGRLVYTPFLTKLVRELSEAVAKDRKQYYTSLIANEFKHT